MREELSCKGECLILNLQIQDYKMPVTWRVYHGEQQKASLKLRKDNGEAGDAELELWQGSEWTVETMGVHRTIKEKIQF